MERESGFYVVRYFGEDNYTILEYVNGNGWQRSLAKPDTWLAEIGEKV